MFERSAPSLRICVAATSVVLAGSIGCGGGEVGPGDGATAPGEPRSTETRVLETGANLLQDTPPVDQIAMYLVGFHPSKMDPGMQMESHHYCDQVNEDFAQCVLYDGNTAEARLHGVEYIISERLHGTLPADERLYWHPHNYEILSGQLRMPGLPDLAEDEALKGKINSYGKTWHFWKTGVFEAQGDALPFGPPHLAWSFNRDGEAKPGLVEARDDRMDLDTAQARERRSEWAGLARPQAGVNALDGPGPGPATGVPGVADSGDASVSRVPVVSIREP